MYVHSLFEILVIIILLKQNLINSGQGCWNSPTNVKILLYQLTINWLGELLKFNAIMNTPVAIMHLCMVRYYVLWL